MIVKVQLSRTTTGPTRRAMVYNKRRTVNFEGDVPPGLFEKMGGSDKAFMHATVTEDGVLDLHPDQFLPDQGW